MELLQPDLVSFTITGTEPEQNYNMTIALGKRNLILKNATIITDAGDQYGSDFQGSVLLELGNIVNKDNVIDSQQNLNYFTVNLNYNIQQYPSVGVYSIISYVEPDIGLTIKSPVEKYMQFSIRSIGTGNVIAKSKLIYYSFQFQAY